MQWRRMMTGFAVAGLPCWTTDQRNSQLRRLGVEVAADAVVRPGVTFRSPWASIGPGAYVGDRCVFDGGGRFVLEANVYLATGCQLLTMTHEIGGPEQRAGAIVQRSIVIGAGSWLCAGVIVQPGVTIGPGCVVLAGAVVTENLSPHGMYGGIPARLVRPLD